MKKEDKIVKYVHKSAAATRKDGTKSVVTIVGKFTQERVPYLFEQESKVEYRPGHFIDGTVMYERIRLHRKLTLGISICRQEDNFNEEYGIEKAKKRIENGYDAGSIETNSVTMLTPDSVEGELDMKLNYICSHIDEYVGKFSKIKHRI